VKPHPEYLNSYGETARSDSAKAAGTALQKEDARARRLLLEAVGDSENDAYRRAFLRSLQGGLAGVRLVISGAHGIIKRGRSPGMLLRAAWQGYPVHFLRHLLARAARLGGDGAGPRSRTILAQQDGCCGRRGRRGRAVTGLGSLRLPCRRHRRRRVKEAVDSSDRWRYRPLVVELEQDRSCEA
jgi:hypothetical protein